jgi:hypothetical protein
MLCWREGVGASSGGGRAQGPRCRGCSFVLPSRRRAAHLSSRPPSPPHTPAPSSSPRLLFHIASSHLPFCKASLTSFTASAPPCWLPPPAPRAASPCVQRHRPCAPSLAPRVCVLRPPAPLRHRHYGTAMHRHQRARCCVPSACLHGHARQCCPAPAHSPPMPPALARPRLPRSGKW